MWVCLFPIRVPSLRLFTLKSHQNIGKSSRFAISRSCTATFYKKWHFGCDMFDKIFPFAMCGFIQGGPSLRVCMFAKVFQTYAKSILVQEVETMHHTDFTNNDIFHLFSGFVSRGGQSGIYAKSHQTIGKTLHFATLLTTPDFHKTCIFFCRSVPFGPLQNTCKP